MRASGALGDDELELPGGVFAAGDAVVIKLNDTRRGVSNGQRGRVTAVDRIRRSLTVQVGAARVELDRTFLDGITQAGDPTLVHGYAVTGHVAQGATVDRAFVLAGESISREWAYVALSRGRAANRIYLAAEPDDARLEFAPGEKSPRAPLDRLTASLRASSVQVLAIDNGSSALAERQFELQDAERERRALERRGLSWLPSRRLRLALARRSEHAAMLRLQQAQRTEAERQHGDRPFVTERELEARWDATGKRLADRATERVLRSGRGFGREL